MRRCTLCNDWHGVTISCGSARRPPPLVHGRGICAEGLMLRRCGAIFCDMPISPFEHQIRQLASTSFLDLVSAIYDLRRIDMEQHVRDALDDIMYREEARRSFAEQTRPPLKWIPQMGTYGR